MTTYTGNYRIPHLDQNIAQPEIPENTAKEIIDSVLGGSFTYNIESDADYTFVQTDDPTQVTDLQNWIIEITDTNIILTGSVSIILPNNTRQYVFKNSTSYHLTFKVSGQTGEILAPDHKMLTYCNGTDIEKIEFIPDTIGTTFISLTDTPSDFTTNTGIGWVLVVNATSNALEWYDLSTKLDATGGTFSGTFSGGIVENYGETRNAEVATSGTIDIDTTNGNVVTVTITAATTFTFTTTFTDTSFTLLLTDASTNVTWPTIKWEGGVEPTWSTTGEDLVTLTRINSVWYGGALIGMA